MPAFLRGFSSFLVAIQLRLLAPTGVPPVPPSPAFHSPRSAFVSSSRRAGDVNPLMRIHATPQTHNRPTNPQKCRNLSHSVAFCRIPPNSLAVRGAPDPAPRPDRRSPKPSDHPPFRQTSNPRASSAPITYPKTAIRRTRISVYSPIVTENNTRVQYSRGDPETSQNSNTRMRDAPLIRAGCHRRPASAVQASDVATVARRWIQFTDARRSALVACIARLSTLRFRLYRKVP